MSDVTAALITARETVTFRNFVQAPPPPAGPSPDIKVLVDPRRSYATALA